MVMFFFCRCSRMYSPIGISRIPYSSLLAQGDFIMGELPVGVNNFLSKKGRFPWILEICMKRPVQADGNMLP